MTTVDPIPNDNDIDLRIEIEKSEMGISKMIITAFTLQAEIDLATEYPRIKKLLERDWAIESEENL